MGKKWGVDFPVLEVIRGSALEKEGEGHFPP